jgi:hypothetical protein
MKLHGSIDYIGFLGYDPFKLRECDLNLFDQAVSIVYLLFR